MSMSSYSKNNLIQILKCCNLLKKQKSDVIVVYFLSMKNFTAFNDIMIEILCCVNVKTDTNLTNFTNYSFDYTNEEILMFNIDNVIEKIYSYMLHVYNCNLFGYVYNFDTVVSVDELTHKLVNYKFENCGALHINNLDKKHNKYSVFYDIDGFAAFIDLNAIQNLKQHFTCTFNKRFFTCNKIYTKNCI